MYTNTPTRVIATQALQYRYEDLPDDVVTWAKLGLLDHCGLAIRGARENLTRILGETLLGRTLTGRDLIPGGISGVSLQDHAMVRASAAHAIDFDDTLFSAMGAHVGSPVNSALLALATTMPVSGKDYLQALVSGYETTARVAALMELQHYEQGFHSTSSMGVFGVAAACAKLLGGDQDSMQRALGLAATQAGGIKAVFGTMTKPFNAGRSSANGILAGRLACQGFTCTTDALEADKGYTSLFLAKPREQWDLPNADAYLIRNNAYKTHAACHATHAMVEGIRALKDNHNFTAEDLQSVQIVVDPVARKTASIGDPRTGLECKFSFSQVAAFALTDTDTASDETYADAILANERINTTRGLVNVVTNEGMRGVTGVRVTLRSGESHESRTRLTDISFGDREQVAAGLHQKFHAVIGAELNPGQARDLEEAIMTLESAPDVIDVLGKGIN